MNIPRILDEDEFGPSVSVPNPILVISKHNLYKYRVVLRFLNYIWASALLFPNIDELRNIIKDS